ncbi:MAG: TIGR04552 family protein [Bdellovibrio sp.]|nr:TIGR04552 family protein [Bdellovibrio sp.]
MNKILVSVLKAKYDFRPDVLDIIIGGRSSIDSAEAFRVQNLEETHRFIASYGYDLDDPIEKAEVLGNYHEALNFIRKTFLQPDNPDGLKLEIPRKLLELADVRELFLLVSMNYPGQSSDSAGKLLKNWACSVLKVMHTIAHIDKDMRTSYFPDIQKQILDRYYKFIHRDDEGRLFMGESPDDPLRVELAAFETKPKKSRNSTLLKLLHKPENVAEELFDRVGIRFTTQTPLGTLRVLKFLKDKMILMPPNIKPSRSRNTLIQVEKFKATLKDVFERAEREELTETQVLAELEAAAHPPDANPENPHSSEFYRSIQFTSRQLIKLRNPVFDELKELKTIARTKPPGEEITKILERIDLKNIQREIRFFYPFEVQLMDLKSAEENEKGRSAHSEYKKAQISTAMKRVMGSLFDGAR